MPTKPIPVIQAPEPEVKVHAKLKAFGKEWKLIRPNALLAGAMADPETADFSDFSRYFMAHVHPSQRQDFMDAAMTQESLDFAYLMDLMDSMQTAVYGDEEEMTEELNRAGRRAQAKAKPKGT